MEKQAGKGLLLAGYIFSVLVCFIGLLIGILLISPNGEDGYAYDEKSRRHGKLMISIAVVVAAVFIAFYVI